MCVAGREGALFWRGRGLCRDFRSGRVVVVIVLVADGGHVLDVLDMFAFKDCVGE